MQFLHPFILFYFILTCVERLEKHTWKYHEKKCKN